MKTNPLMSSLLALSLLGASAPSAAAAEDRAHDDRSSGDAPAAARSVSTRQVPTGSVLRGAIEAAALEAVQRNRRSRRSNPYGTMSYVLMGAGGTMAVYGMVHTSGVECEFQETSVGCRQTKNKALIFSGLGAAGVGLWLFVRGEGQRNTAPSVWFDGRTIVASKRWSF